MFNKVNFLFVTMFGIGRIKSIPGSFASLATTLFLFFLFHILNLSPNIVLVFIILITSLAEGNDSVNIYEKGPHELWPIPKVLDFDIYFTTLEISLLTNKSFCFFL